MGISLHDPKTGIIIYRYNGKFSIRSKFPKRVRVSFNLIEYLLRSCQPISLFHAGIQRFGKPDFTEDADDGRGIEYFHIILVPDQGISQPGARLKMRLSPG